MTYLLPLLASSAAYAQSGQKGERSGPPLSRLDTYSHEESRSIIREMAPMLAGVLGGVLGGFLVTATTPYMMPVSLPLVRMGSTAGAALFSGLCETFLQVLDENNNDIEPWEIAEKSLMAGLGAFTAAPIVVRNSRLINWTSNLLIGGASSTIMEEANYLSDDLQGKKEYQSSWRRMGKNFGMGLLSMACFDGLAKTAGLLDRWGIYRIFSRKELSPHFDAKHYALLIHEPEMIPYYQKRIFKDLNYWRDSTDLLADVAVKQHNFKPVLATADLADVPTDPWVYFHLARAGNKSAIQKLREMPQGELVSFLKKENFVYNLSRHGEEDLLKNFQKTRSLLLAS